MNQMKSLYQNNLCFTPLEKYKIEHISFFLFFQKQQIKQKTKMPMQELYIDNLEPGTEYFVESHIGNTIYKYKATFSHIDGCCAMFIDAYALKNGNFIKANSIGTLRMLPSYIEFGCAKFFHKTCENIRRKVEQQNEILYQKALTKILADLFCPKIHYDENREPLIDETGDYLNYKDVFLQYMKG